MSEPLEILSRYIRPGSLFEGRYEVLQTIGAGAYGVIYLCQDRVLHEEVAVKALPPKEESPSRTAHGRFQREMTIIRNLVHPNIITMYDFGETQDHILFMVLEYLDGHTLQSVCEGSPLPAEIALELTRQIASGLGAAHAKGVIHRDLKPANIMLLGDTERFETDVQAKVLDFGMAKLLNRLDDESIVQLTREGVAVGTPRYIAPEQARGLEVGPWTDLYALGLLMYEMFAGAQAVKADTIESAVRAHVSRKPLALDEIDRVPESVRSLLARLLEKDPEKRYREAGELIDDIERLQRLARAGERSLALMAADPQANVKTTKFRKEDIEASIEEADRRAAAAEDAPAPAAPPPGTADLKIPNPMASLSLELDHDRYERIAGKKPADGRDVAALQQPYRVEYPDRRRVIPRPQTTGQWFEALTACGMAVTAFVLVGAQLYDQAGLTRVLAAAAPVLVALAAALALRSPHWHLGFFRGLLLLASFAVVAAHLYDLPHLIHGLRTDPHFFLRPIDPLPLVRPLEKALVYTAGGYADALENLLR